MSQKLESVTRPPELEWLGGYNDLPPNWEEIDEDTLVLDTKWMNYYPVWIDSKQPRDLPGSYRLSVYGDDTGVAFTTEYWGAYDRTQGRDSDRAKLPAVRWFRFARCLHEFTEKRLSNAYYERTCTKCGFREEYDTSG